MNSITLQPYLLWRNVCDQYVQKTCKRNNSNCRGGDMTAQHVKTSSLFIGTDAKRFQNKREICIITVYSWKFLDLNVQFIWISYFIVFLNRTSAIFKKTFAFILKLQNRSRKGCYVHLIGVPVHFCFLTNRYRMPRLSNENPHPFPTRWNCMALLWKERSHPFMIVRSACRIRNIDVRLFFGAILHWIRAPMVCMFVNPWLRVVNKWWRRFTTYHANLDFFTVQCSS